MSSSIWRLKQLSKQWTSWFKPKAKRKTKRKVKRK